MGHIFCPGLVATSEEGKLWIHTHLCCLAAISKYRNVYESKTNRRIRNGVPKAVIYEQWSLPVTPAAKMASNVMLFISLDILRLSLGGLRAVWTVRFHYIILGVQLLKKVKKHWAKGTQFETCRRFILSLIRFLEYSCW